ncbi:MAG: hypothetical protein HQK58_03770 [Deltaproteobacteria bacterium]|nr:hypothetical protein [Deltaproteobacteria bacterium]
MSADQRACCRESAVNVNPKKIFITKWLFAAFVFFTFSLRLSIEFNLVAVCIFASLVVIDFLADIFPKKKKYLNLTFSSRPNRSLDDANSGHPSDRYFEADQAGPTNRHPGEK